MLQIGEGNESYYYLDYYKWISAYKRAHLNKITNKIRQLMKKTDF